MVLIAKTEFKPVRKSAITENTQHEALAINHADSNCYNNHNDRRFG
jgi:hypothetical protein